MKAITSTRGSRSVRSAAAPLGAFVLAALAVFPAAGQEAEEPAEPAAAAAAPETPAEEAAAEPEERPTGLPKKLDWTFNFDFGIGTFGFGNSLYTNVRPDPSGDLSDNWSESFAKPALSMDYDMGESDALRQAQRGRRAHLLGAALGGGGRGGLVVPHRGPLPRLALGHLARRVREPARAHRRTHALPDRPRLPALGRRRRRAAAAAASGATRARRGRSPASSA